MDEKRKKIKKKRKYWDRIGKNVEIGASIVSLLIAVCLCVVFAKESAYRKDRAVDLSANVYVDQDIVSYENMKDIVQDGKIDVVMRMTFSNSTKYALTISNIKVEVFDKNKDGKYKGMMEMRPHLSERDSNVESSASIEQNAYFLTIPSGEARDAYFAFQAPLSDAEMIQLLKFVNESKYNYETAFYRIVSNCIARTYEDYDGVFRVSYNQYHADEEDDEITRCYSFRYNLTESSMPINITDINAGFDIHTTDFDDAIVQKYVTFIPKVSAEYTDDLERRIREQCRFFPERTIALDKIAYMESLGKMSDKKIVGFDYLSELEAYTGHTISDSFGMSSIEHYYEAVDSFLENNMEIIKNDSQKYQYVGMNVYESEEGHCYITIVFSNEE